MSDRERDAVQAIVIEALSSIDGLRPPARRFIRGGDVRRLAVYGAGGALDSLELVNFIVEVEQRLEERLGATVTLADERAVSGRLSPFRSVDAFVEFIVARLQEAAHAR